MLNDIHKSEPYTARRQAGPSKTAVIPSTATTPASLAAYLESPLLYSFPANCFSKYPFKNSHSQEDILNCRPKTHGHKWKLR